jgi:hypothetical protein
MVHRKLIFFGLVNEATFIVFLVFQRGADLLGLILDLTTRAVVDQLAGSAKR